MKPPIGRDTRLCMSLAARPGNFGSRFHNRLYERLGLDYVYKAFTTTDLEGAIRGVRALDVRGCAVSMPFKEAVIPLLDELAGSAAAINSVNTIVNDDGTLTGYNTDYGAVRDLLDAVALDPALPFVLRGSGGMARAVAAALRDRGHRAGTIVARNEAAGRALADTYGFAWHGEVGGGAPLLVNATPIGMSGDDEGALAFPQALIDACAVAFEVVAIPAETPFLRHARAAGKARIAGTEVAVLQALEQFVLYTGVRPGADDVAHAAAFARGEVD